MILQIPFSGEASFVQEVVLESVPYLIQFNWNSRGNFWDMNIKDRDQNPLVEGIKLLLGEELLKKFPDSGLPPGTMFIIDNAGTDTPIIFDDFSTGRCSLIYVESV
jgi:hypothetical protein